MPSAWPLASPVKIGGVAKQEAPFESQCVTGPAEARLTGGAINPPTIPFASHVFHIEESSRAWDI